MMVYELPWRRFGHVGPKAILLLRRIVGGFVNLLMVLMIVVPALAITFFAVLGGIWIAKSF